MVIKNTQSGFTLIELMVVIGIFMIVASVLLFNYSTFNTNVSVNNLAQEIGLGIRQAQSYATSVRSIEGFSTENFPSYGVVFSLDTQQPADPYLPFFKQFILFADTNKNNAYDSNKACGNPNATGAECLSSYSITTSDVLSSFSYDSGLGASCITNGKATILFHRPSPDATIIVDDGSGTLVYPSYLSIDVTSLKGLTKTILVWNTGQISVEDAAPRVKCVSFHAIDVNRTPLIIPH